MEMYTCCFIGHRVINETEELRSRLTEVIEKLITQEKVDRFLFGSKSRFDALCLEILTNAKEKHPYIKRIYVRAEFSVINDEYREYLLQSYDETYYPEKIVGAGRAAYVERNREMIDKSRFCVIYYDEANAPVRRKSGTKTALDYAVKRRKNIILLPT